MKTLKWFTDRIGKRVYRDASTCDCTGCRDAENYGVIIENKEHGEYLRECDIEMDLNYRDNE